MQVENESACARQRLKHKDDYSELCASGETIDGLKLVQQSQNDVFCCCHFATNFTSFSRHSCVFMFLGASEDMFRWR